MASPVESAILVIFGSMGDLTWRKLAPALYNLLFMRADQVEASWSVLMPVVSPPYLTSAGVSRLLRS